MAIELIRQKIKEGKGKIPFSTYMELALYAPQTGYYTGHARKFGPLGDFVTAPELSPLFGQCIGRALHDYHGIDTILEWGAGTGNLAKTVLEHYPHIKKYYILDISPDLIRRQHETLAPYLSKITWLSTLDELPKHSFSGLILANEVIDAFPATRFLINGQGIIQEYYVTDNNNQLDWILDKPSQPEIITLINQLNILNNNPHHYTSELQLGISPWIKNISEILHSGIILLCDYGFPRHEFYHPQRNQGTLMCHYQHQSNSDPFFKPGEQDITVHVDFTAIAEAALEHNFQVAGYTCQTNFLCDAGITDFIKTPQDSADAKILTHPNEMGELFKCMALTKNWDNNNQPLTGFRLHDRRYGL